MGYDKFVCDAMMLLMRVRHHHHSSGPKTLTGTILFFLCAVFFLLAAKSDIIDKAVSNKTLAFVLRILSGVIALFLMIGSVKAG